MEKNLKYKRVNDLTNDDIAKLPRFNLEYKRFERKDYCTYLATLYLTNLVHIKDNKLKESTYVNTLLNLDLPQNRSLINMQNVPCRFITGKSLSSYDNQTLIEYYICQAIICTKRGNLIRTFFLKKEEKNSLDIQIEKNQINPIDWINKDVDVSLNDEDVISIFE